MHHRTEANTFLFLYLPSKFFGIDNKADFDFDERSSRRFLVMRISVEGLLNEYLLVLLLF
jgi:hypothetical protein